MKKIIMFFSFTAIMMGYTLAAEGAGTLSVTFQYLDNNGVAQPLPNAYVYLQNGSRKPPMEAYFSQPVYILGPSDAYGRITASVAEGNYYIRIIRRNPVGSSLLGPPRGGDYTWNQTNTIAINTGVTTDLGVKFAWYFFAAPITVTGRVTNNAGTPLSGRYVRAQTDPCIIDFYGYSNHCGDHPRYLAQQKTDADGRYTLLLRDPGTYYIYTSPCLGDQHQAYQGNPCVGTSPGTIAVQAEERKTLNIIGY